MKIAVAQVTLYNDIEANGTTISKGRKCFKEKLAHQQVYVPVDENEEIDEEL